jgi:N-acetylhexosamine 1-kinase
MTAAVLRHFFDSPSKCTVTQLSQGLINTTFKVHEPNGKWVLQAINPRVFSDPVQVLQNWLRIVEHLKSVDYPLAIPMPRATLSGAFWHCDEQGTYWRAMAFLANTVTPERQPNPQTAFEVAKAFARYNLALHHLPVNEISTVLAHFHDTQQRFEQFDQLLQSPQQYPRMVAVRREIDQLEPIREVALTVAERLESGSWPLRLAHNDAKSGNMLLDQHSGLPRAVIDWDTTMPGSWLADYGDLIRSLVPSVDESGMVGDLYLNNEVAAAVRAGYTEVLGVAMTPQERTDLDLGAHWIVGEQALRFLSDYVAGDVYYAILYPDHNLDRARNQLRLFECLLR